MEYSSRIYTSPSFNTHPSNGIADIADRVVHELRTENGFQHDDVFTFSDDDNPPETDHNHTDDEEEREFEFPVSADDVITDDPISLRYPLFDRSLLSVDSPPPRPSLKQLLSEDRDTPSSEDLTGVAPGTYCVWKPNTKKELPRGKHKKGNSVSVDNISKRWKVRDLLKRSYSDDNYTTGKESPVVVFLPPNKIGKSGKPEKNIPAYKANIGNIRIPPHYQYRQGADRTQIPTATDTASYSLSPLHCKRDYFML